MSNKPNKVESIQQPALTDMEGIAVFFPTMTIQRYANGAGLSIDTVRGMVRLGHLPTIKTGKYRLINMVALLRMCQDAAKDSAAKLST